MLRLTGAGMLSAALLFAVGTGLAGLVERHPASWPWVRRATPVALAAAALLGGIAAWAAFGTLPAVVNTVLLWSGPWGWAAQGLTALAGRRRRPWWPVATALLAAVALAALAAAAARGGRGARGRAPGPGPHPGRDVLGRAEHEHPRRGRGLRRGGQPAAARPARCRRPGGGSSCCSGGTCSRWPGPRPGWPPRWRWPGWPSG